MAACGIHFTVAVTEDGELFACGQGGHGQLGLGAALHQQQPARAGGPELFANQRIRLAAAGCRHLAVVAEDGAVYTCGSGDYGRLGLGDEQPRRRLTRVPQGLFAGLMFRLFITERKGNIHVCGVAHRHGVLRRLAHDGGDGGGARVDLRPQR